MAKEKICGIYCIENIINHKKYIGQSQNVFRRMYNHKNLLRNNKHHNAYLQNSWNKYGEKSFIFYLIEVCDMSNIDDLERYYISKFNTTDSSKGYNLESGGNIGKKHSLKTIEKLLEIHKNEKIPVYCIELDKTFDGLIDASKEFNISYNAIKRCCAEKCGTCCGYHWLYLSDKTDDNINKALNKNVSLKKPVYCFELDTVFESEFDARQKTGAKNIDGCCKKSQGKKSSGKHPITHKPLHWCYVEDMDTYTFEEDKRKCSPVNCKEIICIETQVKYKSIAEAERLLNICHIRDVCKGRRKTAGGYTFAYV